MAYDPAIGTRVDGKTASRRSRWYECAVCGFHFPEDETHIPDAPMPHAGLRICYRDAEEPSYDWYQQMSPYRPTGEENLP